VDESIDEKRLSWFGGNTDALSICKMLITLTHTWDDIVDKDKPLTESDINEAFKIALVYLPANKLYQSIMPQMLPMWVQIISAYETANTYERNKDAHGIEISHSLRYAAGHMLAYIVILCVGDDKAKDVLPEVWKEIYFERFEDYRKEHLDD